MELVEELVPYVVLLLNCGLFGLIRRLAFQVTSKRWYLVVTESIATWELCADVAELGVVYERHGIILYAIALLACCVWWCKVFGDAEACPCGPIEDMLFGVGDGDYKARLAGELIGAIFTALYIRGIWSLQLIREHETLATTVCQTSLAVTVRKGAFIEGIITCISRFVAMRSTYWKPNVSTAINSITTVILVLAALTTTGGYFNPIMASALMLGCEGNTLMEHFLVYWLGALVGGFFGHYLHFRLEIAIKEKCA
ncbi:aquaporin-11-like [Ornithodoros turicata]|uniref:aquaporin-11-like n=1 Tax=Ornithodoros turicata TaxID=34597 RepID=UPI0031398AED